MINIIIIVIIIIIIIFWTICALLFGCSTSVTSLPLGIKDDPRRAATKRDQ